jgi:hypothetical protein
MQIVSLCAMCQRVYAPDQMQGVRKLNEFRGYTVADASGSDAVKGRCYTQDQ